MTSAPEAHSQRTPTDEDRARMVASVDGMILKTVSKSPVPSAERDDAAQDCRLELWRASGKFDVSGEAKWSTFAMNVIKTVLCRYLGDHGKHFNVYVMSRGETLPTAIEATATEDRQRHAADPDDPDDLGTDEQVRELDRTVRKKLFAGTLDVLTDDERRLVEAIAFHGLTVDQVAEQRGHPVKIVKTNLINVCRKLAAIGRVPEAIAVRLGFNVTEMTTKAKVRGSGIRVNAGRRARRELVAEMLSLGWPQKRIAAELGASRQTINVDAKLAGYGRNAGKASRPLPRQLKPKPTSPVTVPQ